MSENGELYTAGKKFILPPALTAWTNSTSEKRSPSVHVVVVVERLHNGKVAIKADATKVQSTHLEEWIRIRSG